MFTRASKVGRELVDDAGEDAKHATRLMFTPIVAQLMTKRGRGTPMWCMHVGGAEIWICYDQKARFVYEH